MSLFLSLIAIAILSGCNTSQLPADTRQYPYSAPPEKARRILNNYRLLKPGMDQESVLKLMGAPDEKNQLYANTQHFESRDTDGEAWEYLIFRRQAYGSMVERGEQSVRLEFDINKKLQRIEPVGLKGLSPALLKVKGRTGIPGAAY